MIQPRGAPAITDGSLSRPRLTKRASNWTCPRGLIMGRLADKGPSADLLGAFLGLLLSCAQDSLLSLQREIGRRSRDIGNATESSTPPLGAPHCRDRRGPRRSLSTSPGRSGAQQARRVRLASANVRRVIATCVHSISGPPPPALSTIKSQRAESEATEHRLIIKASAPVTACLPASLSSSSPVDLRRRRHHHHHGRFSSHRPPRS